MDKYHLLNKINAYGSYNYEKASSFEKESMDDLFKDGYLTFEIVGNDNNTRCMYRLTLKGKTFIHDKAIEKRRWQIPVIISVLALMKSYGLGIEKLAAEIWNLIMQLRK